MKKNKNNRKYMEMKEKRKILYGISLITQIGITMIVPMFLCLFIGIKASEYWGKEYLVMISLFLGMIVSFRNAYHLTKKMFLKDKIKEDEKRKYFDDIKKEREINKKKKILDEKNNI